MYIFAEERGVQGIFSVLLSCKFKISLVLVPSVPTLGSLRVSPVPSVPSLGSHGVSNLFAVPHMDSPELFDS